MTVGIDSVVVEIRNGGVRQLVVGRACTHRQTGTIKAYPIVATNNLAGVNGEVRRRIVVVARWSSSDCGKRNSNVSTDGRYRLVGLDDASLEGVKISIVV